MTPELYPPAPAGVPEDLAAPTGRYKRQTAAAVIGVVIFFLLYFGMTYWFGLVAYRAFAGWGEHTQRALFVGIPAAFLFLVMIKGLFARQKLSRDALLQVTEADEPELFAFIHRIADDTGAPRPHKVFLSPDVNAAVFLDVGLINLIIPSRKNLIVGVGLVNSLTLDELKAVIAHEFGHFAQRSMGVGQWVYVAQGFVRDLIARRDALDNLVHWVSRFDFRIAWIGWGLRLLIWALRALVDQLFRFVVLLSRALTRQMEFQADLVSVSVAGSDSLVHALHRLPAADRGWGEAANFVVSQARKGRRTEDLFAVQSRFIERYREVHALADYGQTPERPKLGGGGHRVFAHSIADVPQMWSTHPSNQDREESCKARYFESHLDPRSAWLVFEDPALVRKRVTAHFLDLATRPNPDDPAPPTPPVEMVSVPLEESLRTVDEIFGRAALDRRYQGLYTTMAMTRALAPGESPHAMPQTSDSDALLAELDAVFDDALSDRVEEFFQLDEELAQLEGLKRGFLQAPGGVITHRGRQLRRKELKDVCAETKAELEEHRASLAERFRRARGAGLRIARLLDERRGPGEDGTRWELHLEGLTELLRYAEHTGADLVDNVTYFEHVLAIVFADGHVSQSEMRRLVAEGSELAYTIRRVFDAREQVLLPAPVRQRLTKDGMGWDELIGAQLHLTAPTEQDFADDWIGVAASWWSLYLQALDALATSTLDVLLEAEEYLATCLRNGSDPGDAPAAASVPGDYRSFPFGSERERQERLGWWDRFQVAEGFAGGAMRFVVAGALLTPAVVAGFIVSEQELHLYNGLDRTVVVSVADESYELFPGMDAAATVSDDADIRTTTREGELIEELTIDDLTGMDQPVYNVAGAAAFARWWAVYGVGAEPDPVFETGRVLEADARYLFREPPPSISSGSGETRAVYDSVDDPLVLSSVLNGAEAEIAAAHLRWDRSDSLGLGTWVALLPEDRQEAAVRERFERDPSPRTWVLLQTFGSEGDTDALCASGRSFPESVTALCADDERLPALAEASDDSWLHMLAGDRAFRERDYDAALGFYERARLRGAFEAAIVARRARVLRATGRYHVVGSLSAEGDRYFEYLMAVESGSEPGVGGLAQARAAGKHDPATLEALAAEPTADELAFAAASEGAPAALTERLAADRRDFRSPTAAVCAWALGWRSEDPALRDRAAAAYASIDGELDLAAIDLGALRATPEALVADEQTEGYSIRTQAELRLAAWIAWEGEVPTEWRELVHAVLFLAERPALSR